MNWIGKLVTIFAYQNSIFMEKLLKIEREKSNHFQLYQGELSKDSIHVT